MKPGSSLAAARNRRVPSPLVVLCAAAALGCQRTPTAHRKPLVVVSVAPQAFFVEQIAGDLVETMVMIPPGANPHIYEPTMHQLQAVSDASLYVKVGHPRFPFEQAWLAKLLAENERLPVVDGLAGIQNPSDDPHVWVSPVLVRIMADNIAVALERLHPEHRATLQVNRARFRQAIDRLDSDIRDLLRGLPRRRFYVLHPAWGYFAETYGLEQVAIERDGKEPDPKHLAELIAQAKAEQVKVIFTQPQFAASSARVVGEEIGARVEAIDPQARDWLNNLRSVAAQLAEALRA